MIKLPAMKAIILYFEAFDTKSLSEDEKIFEFRVIFGCKNDDNNKNFYNNNVYAASTENANMFKFLYSYNLITRAKLKSNSYKNFFEGKNSRYYLRQIYRYPFSRSLFRTHYDAINDNKFSRINNVPGTSFYTIFNGLNLLPYDGEARLKTPEFSPFIHSYEDKSTSISNYFRARFNRNSIGSYKPGQYGYITDVRLRNIYYTNRFKWAGRHTGGINSNSFKIFKRIEKTFRKRKLSIFYIHIIYNNLSKIYKFARPIYFFVTF